MTILSQTTNSILLSRGRTIFQDGVEKYGAEVRLDKLRSDISQDQRDPIPNQAIYVGKISQLFRNEWKEESLSAETMMN